MHTDQDQIKYEKKVSCEPVDQTVTYIHKAVIT